VKLDCAVSGVEVGGWYWGWCRKCQGKGLEWLGGIKSINGGGEAYYNSCFNNQIVISRDTAKNEFYLELRTLTIADSAVYFCVRCNYAYFDYWGQGTMVTVTSETPKAPSLFPLIPSGDNSETIDITIGCLAKNFLPDSIDFSWDNQRNESIGNQNYIKFPSILSSGTYTAVSQAKVPRSTWDEFQLFYCKATHPQGNKIVPVVRQSCRRLS
uniref:Ig-like domain-containing protein n=1 Tax=Pseudonaja textilis TaxID=8673 RepID=A0A670Z0B1_PSETE